MKCLLLLLLLLLTAFCLDEWLVSLERHHFPIHVTLLPSGSYLHPTFVLNCLQWIPWLHVLLRLFSSSGSLLLQLCPHEFVTQCPFNTFLHFFWYDCFLGSSRSSSKRFEVRSQLQQYLACHNIEYLCLNLFMKFRFSILREFWRQANTVLPLLGGDAPRLGWWNLASR